MRILVVGGKGLLGSAFCEKLGSNRVGADAMRFDGENAKSVARILGEAKPDVVINCAAYTNVENEEVEPAVGAVVNTALPRLIALACREIEAKIVHISSTGCYGRWKDEPYTEADEPHPTTAHHRAKIAGEMAVRESRAEHLIIRTGWLFGGRPGAAKNFVWNRLIEARSKTTMNSDPFQRGNPTPTLALVEQCMAMLEARLSGTFNAVSEPSATRLEYVRQIIKESRLPCEVEPTMEPFKRRAAVSPNEAAKNDRLSRLGLDQMPDWRAAIGTYVADLMQSPEWKRLSE